MMLYHVYVINKNSYSTLSRGIPWSIPLVTHVISWNTHEPLTHGENTSENTVVFRDISLESVPQLVCMYKTLELGALMKAPKSHLMFLVVAR